MDVENWKCVFWFFACLVLGVLLGGDVLIFVCYDSWCLAYFVDDLLIIV